MIRARNLRKVFGPVVAVDNVSFHIAEGEIVGFLGPNGAGKTTAIRMLTCFLPPTSGTATVAGHDVLTESMAVRRKIGYLPENVPLYPEMRVDEYLHFRGRLRGMSRSERREAIGRVAERCWLGEFVHRPIGQLSKGMRQRVGLAECLLHNPPVLILDEPTVGLDPSQIRETRKLIKELAPRHTVMLSTHILPEVEQICDRSIIIAGGRIVASGTIDELRERIRGTSRIIAEIRGPQQEVEEAIRRLDGVVNLACESRNGWNRLAIETAEGRDPREQVASLAASRQWALREIRLEVGSLEEFFVQIVARQAEQQPRARR